MTCLPLLLCLSLLLHSELAAPPLVPVNLFVDSLNFNHVLQWDPGPSTPPGTEYGVFVSEDRKNWEQQCNLTAGTSMRVVLPDSEFKYYLFVEAFYNQTRSRSREYKFAPYEQTKIGPPEVLLAGYENYIQINISMPQADETSSIPDIQKFYGADFKVSYRRGNDGKILELSTPRKNVTLSNLRTGVEYCVQVELDVKMNKNTLPSAWKCTFTTLVDPKTSFVLSVVTGVPIAAIFILTSCLIGLFYAGVICKLKEASPRVLMTSLTKGFILTPEWTIPDPIIITSVTGYGYNPATASPANKGANSEDEDDDEDDEMHYVNRGGGLSSGESSHQDSGSLSQNSEPAVAQDSGRLRLLAEVKAPPAEIDEDEVEAEGAEVCLVQERGQIGVWGQVTGQDEERVKVQEDEEVRDISGNVNLFSVTLASMAVRGEEEEKTDFLKVPILELLSTTDSQPESGDQILLIHRDFTVSGYKGGHTDTLTEEGEEEEEFSAYLTNR